MSEKHYWNSPFIEWARDIPNNYEYFVFHIRKSRQKAIIPAILEAFTILKDLTPLVPIGGPSADQKGVFWIALPPENVKSAIIRFPNLGYTDSIEQVYKNIDDCSINENFKIVRWKGKDQKLKSIYMEDDELRRKHDPDQRYFTIKTGDGEFRTIKGYRGDGSLLGRRALPACDAKLLVNLAFLPTFTDSPLLLDPFAGAGGIVYESINLGIKTISIDTDPILRKGLYEFGAFHSIANATSLPYPNESIDMIVSEPPYIKTFNKHLEVALMEFFRVTRSGGRISLLCARRQASIIRMLSLSLGLLTILDSEVNRKGTDVVVFVLEKN